jgi:alpha-ketoglutarate-dependent taurine dioxygenase
MATPNHTHWDVQPLAGQLGAELRGPDLGNDVGEDAFDELRQALDHHLVLAVRDQTLDPASLHRVARRLGPFSGNPVHVPLDGFEDIVRFDRPADDRGPVPGDNWHMDLAWFEKPPGATMLYGEVVPPVGGDTVFASLAAAWNRLSPRMQTLLQDLVGVHSGKGVFAVNAALSALRVQDSGRAVEDLEVMHPLVCTHPRTGRRYLMVSSVLRRFDGMTEVESRPLIDFLLQHVVRPEHTCRLRWAPGTLAIWANSCLLHAAVNDYTGHRRVVLRTTVEGFRPSHVM